MCSALVGTHRQAQVSKRELMHVGSPGTVTKVPVPRILCHSNLTEVTEVPGTGMGILQNLQKFRVRHESVSELTEVPGIVARAYRTHIRNKNYIPVPRVFVALAYRTSRVPGTGMNVLQNSQKFYVG